jgi:hypothetical protein
LYFVWPIFFFKLENIEAVIFYPQVTLITTKNKVRLLGTKENQFDKNDTAYSSTWANVIKKFMAVNNFFVCS